jgi:ketosteroid isomerase-like protein
MSGRPIHSAITALALSVAGLFGCARAETAAATSPSSLTPREVTSAARAAIEQWRQSYEVRSVEVLSELYAHDLDLVVVQEGTPYLGWSSVESLLKDRLARATAIRIRLKDMQVASLAPDVASAVATMTREITEGATTVTENGTLTLVLRQDGGRWVITVEHYSYKRAP